jgi:hypothetical protein
MKESAMKFIGIRMPVLLVGKVNEVLATEGMGMTEYVRGLIRDNLRARGLISPEDDPAQIKMDLPSRRQVG